MHGSEVKGRGGETTLRAAETGRWGGQVGNMGPRETGDVPGRRGKAAAVGTFGEAQMTELPACLRFLLPVTISAYERTLPLLVSPSQSICFLSCLLDRSVESAGREVFGGHVWRIANRAAAAWFLSALHVCIAPIVRFSPWVPTSSRHPLCFCMRLIF